MEPVYSCAIYDSWKFSRSNPQSGTNRGKTKNNSQLATNSVNKELPTVFSRIDYSSPFDFIADTLK